MAKLIVPSVPQTLGLTRIAAQFQTSSAAFVDVTGGSVQVNVRDKPVRVRVYVPMISHSAAGAWLAYLAIREGTTTLGYSQIAGSTGASEPHGGAVVDVPLLTSEAAPGSHTYKMSCAVITAGTMTLAMGADHKGFIEVLEY